VVDAPLRDRSLRTARHIANSIVKIATSPPNQLLDLSLGRGRSGIAVFLAHAGKCLKEPAFDEVAYEMIAEMVEELASTRLRPSLYNGFSGIAWAANHVIRCRNAPESIDFSAVDNALLSLVQTKQWRGEFDLISGLVGFGVYALDRLPNPTAERILVEITARLHELAQRNDGRITWFLPPEQMHLEARLLHPQGWYNLGVAHGVPGIISLLGAICRAGVEPGRTCDLIEGAVRWLTAQRLPEESVGCFPNWVEPGLSPRDETRLAWCYGDAGVAAALMVAGKGTGNATVRELAHDIGIRAALRSPETSKVVDAGLCHGSAGLAHLFARLHRATGDSRFRKAADYWLTVTLDMRVEDLPFGGFHQVLMTPETGSPRREATPGLLGGSAGIGLALLTAASEDQLGWDTILLCNM
jgi:lantibiotic modifying enzyme